MDLNSFLDYSILEFGTIHFTVWRLIAFLGVLILIKVVNSLLIGKWLSRMLKKRNVDPGRTFSITQFSKYIVITFGILIAVSTLGIKLSLLWAGSAALLVGVGLGLQQTFNDLISGLIILLEGSVEVDDIVIVDDIVGRVESIGIRTSKVQDRDDNMLIVPNSKLIVENVRNWSHNEKPSRFHINIGVAYSSNPELVKQLLLEATVNIKGVLKEPKPSVHLANFGESSLDFKLFFYLTNIMEEEIIKSDLRFAMYDILSKNNINIPFPQREVTIKK